MSVTFENIHGTWVATTYFRLVLQVVVRSTVVSNQDSGKASKGYSGIALECPKIMTCDNGSRGTLTKQEVYRQS